MELYLSEKDHVFVLKEDSKESILDYAVKDAHTWDYRHTFVSRSQRGQGLAGKLVKFALDHAREHSIKIIPTCPVVANYLERHPEYADVVAK